MRQTTALAMTLLALSTCPALACGSGGGTIYLLMFVVMYGFPLSLLPAFLLAIKSKRADRWSGFFAGVVFAFSVLWLLMPHLDWNNFGVAAASLLAATSGAGVAPALVLRFIRPDR